MTIGMKLLELRTARNLSQSDLADLLDVSRQSVSKWETDAAVPELDKLIKLCDVFAVSLDELVGREEKGTLSHAVKIVPRENPNTHQKIIGYILLAVSLLAVILVWILADRENDLYLPIPLIASAFSCSLLCLFVKRHTAYWCIWSVAAPIVLFLPKLGTPPVLQSVNVALAIVSAVLYCICLYRFLRQKIKYRYVWSVGTVLLLGSPHMIRLSPLRTAFSALAILAVIMALFARKCVRDPRAPICKKTCISLLFGWLLLIALCALSCGLVLQSAIRSAFALTVYLLLELLIYIGTALLSTETARCIERT